MRYIYMKGDNMKIRYIPLCTCGHHSIAVVLMICWCVCMYVEKKYICVYVGLLLYGESEAYPIVGTIEDCVVFTNEWVTQNPHVGNADIHGLQTNLAAVLTSGIRPLHH